MPYYISPPPQNPVSRFIAGIVAVLAIAAAFMIGMVAFLVIGGIGLLTGIAIWVRVAWIKHKLKKSGFTPESFASNNARQSPESDPQGQVIDAEYEVVSEQKDPP